MPFGEPAVKQGYVVQDRESGLWLAPIDGDVGFVRDFASVGVFYDLEEAEYALIDHCSGSGSVFVVCCNDDWSLRRE